MSDPGPIQEEVREQANAIGKLIDSAINPDGVRRWGFALLLFGLDGQGVNDSRMNYISNADRDDMLRALKELVARFEGRWQETEAGR